MIRFLIHALLGDHDTDHPLDFVPVQRDDKKAKRSLAVKLEEARARHGKEFRSHTHVDRGTPPSRDLVDLDNASKSISSAPDTVRPINAKKERAK